MNHTRLRPLWWLRDIFLMGAATPPFARRGGIRSKTLNFGRCVYLPEPSTYLSIHLNDDRLGLTDTATQGGQAVVGPSAACRAAPPAQFVDQGDDQPGAGRAGWVAHGNCAAVDVGLGL